MHSVAVDYFEQHVIVEKPAFSHPGEMAEIIELANQQRVFFFEAARNTHINYNMIMLFWNHP